MKNTKNVVFWILSFAGMLLVVQNMAPVRTRFLWLAADIPVILLLIFAGAGTLVSGMPVALLIQNSMKNKPLEGERHER